jgi:DNA polymerase III sliding clamp (beta) subunit (PCNA family)
LPADFTNGLALVEGFAATNSAFPARCGVSIGPDGLAATDGFRAGFYEMSIPVEDESILPIKAVGEILKFGNMESFSSVEGWLHFRSQDGVLFSVRKRKGDFPREGIKNLLNFDGLGAPFLFPEDMIKSLDRAAVLSSAGENGGEFVLLSLDPKGNLIIHGERQFGEINEKFLKSDKWSFPPGASLKVNPNFLMNILSQGREYYPKDDRYLLFKSGKFAGVIALVK